MSDEKYAKDLTHLNHPLPIYSLSFQIILIGLDVLLRTEKRWLFDLNSFTALLQVLG